MFGQILRQTRQVQGMTQQELAERLFVSRQITCWGAQYHKRIR